VNGNNVPACVGTFCVDTDADTGSKLVCGGWHEDVGSVTVCGYFLSTLAGAL